MELGAQGGFDPLVGGFNISQAEGSGWLRFLKCPKHETEWNGNFESSFKRLKSLTRFQFVSFMLVLVLVRMLPDWAVSLKLSALCNVFGHYSLAFFFAIIFLICCERLDIFDFRCVTLRYELGTSGMNSLLSVETDTLFKVACLQIFSWKVCRLTVFAEK